MNAIGYAILVFTISFVTGLYLGFKPLVKIEISDTKIKEWVNTISPVVFCISALLALATLFIMWR